MSENFLRFIPANFLYLPSSFPQQEVQTLLTTTFPHADEIQVTITDEVVFVDSGTNLERIKCPVCKSLLPFDWWSQMMNRAYEESRFTNLIVTVPCCQATTTLNDLQYEWPSGFARFLLEVRNPGDELKQEAFRHLEQILECRLRILWTHL